ncbi:palmitoyltransferase swf1 [Lepidopterella palustris CBS 459.81]|uniref:Palmitoyltransferase n=1 Tax=Lepidopterella palustris CBS 459.81 TaxID=1314670 RepID=A0A8E2JEA0_9PEZI|nr:palmitoyltransferase swf1 [Lepidopterella palustris CBS 459.81]
MGVVRNLTWFVFSITFITFVAFFGRLPALRNTPIGSLHRLLVNHVPNLLRNVDVLLTNGRITRASSRFGNYLAHEKNPSVIVSPSIFFLGMVSGSAILFVPEAWPHLPLHHRLTFPVLLFLPYLFEYLCARHTPSTYITPSNHASQMRLYPYDFILYHPGIPCSTCHLIKPARSKHCSICKTCVARADHHCIWVNNCLGRGNYKHFLFLLLSITILLAYSAYLAYFLLAPSVRAHYALYGHLWNPTPQSSHAPSTRLSTVNTVLSTALAPFLARLSLALDIGGLSIAGVGLLALLTSPMPLGLLGYHLYLIWAGMTTNESSKWSDWRDEMADGVVFLGAQLPSASFAASDGFTSWPQASRQVLVRTINGQPPEDLPKHLKGVVDEREWRRVWRLGEVENVYDLGFWGNLGEMMK